MPRHRLRTRCVRLRFEQGPAAKARLRLTATKPSRDIWDPSTFDTGLDEFRDMRVHIAAELTVLNFRVEVEISRWRASGRRGIDSQGGDEEIHHCRGSTRRLWQPAEGVPRRQ